MIFGLLHALLFAVFTGGVCYNAVIGLFPPFGMANLWTFWWVCRTRASYLALAGPIPGQAVRNRLSTKSFPPPMLIPT